MTGDGGDCGHREGKEFGDNGLEDLDHVVEAFGSGRNRAGSLSPGEIETVREEFSMGSSDENGAWRGFRLDFGKSFEDGGDVGGAEAVLVIAGES